MFPSILNFECNLIYERVIHVGFVWYYLIYNSEARDEREILIERLNVN